MGPLNPFATALFFCLFCFQIHFATAERNVWIIVDWAFGEAEEFWVESKQIYESGPQVLVPQHAQLHIEPDANNGALRLQVREYGGDGTPAQPGSWETVMQADALDFKNPGVPDSGAPAFSWQPDEVRRRILLGQTELANIDFIDQSKRGVGIIADTVSDPAGPFKGGEYSMPKAGCMAFVRELQKKIFPDQPLNAEFEAWYQAKADYLGYDTTPQKLTVASMKVKEWGDKYNNLITRYEIQEHNKLKVQFTNQPQGSADTFWDEPESTRGTKRRRLLEPWEEQKAPALSTWDGAPIRDPNKVQGDACRRLRRNGLHQRCSSGSAPVEEAGTSELAMTRVNKVTSIISVVAKSAVEAAGAAGVALGAAFVILDFVNGNWVGGGFGAAGLALGILATAGIAGPIGWVVGGLVEALFAILPGLFEEPKGRPHVDNTTEIIQWVMFGDADHTGNEECQKQNPNCQAVYGPGTLSAVFGFNYFDAIAFLINFNNGYPMSIPDMAAAFQVTGTPGAIATYDCHNGKKHQTNRGQVGDDPLYCNHPQFSLSREFMLPVINETAAAIYERIFPAGDCKLLDAASNAQTFPLYKITITGLPVSIACNLTAPLSNLPTLSPTDSAPQNPAANQPYISPANESTNNQAGASITPPPAQAFAVAFGESNAVCISNSDGGKFCLPTGTYSQPSGQFGYSLSGANTLSLPPGSSLTLTHYDYRPGVDPIPKDKTFTTNQSPSDDAFSYAVSHLGDDRSAGGAGVFSISIPDSVPMPPAACFYTEPQYKGELWCMGPGGAEFSGTERSVAKSVGVYGGATVWVYAQSYGDPGGQKLTASIPDLSTEPFGTGDNFSGKVVGAWIYAVEPSA